MKNDRTFSKWTICFGITCLIVSIFLPLIVQILFYLHAPLPFLVAQWSAGDILGYCSGIGSAAATIIAVVMTIREERTGRIETQRLASIPCITLKLHNSDEKTNTTLSAMENNMRFIVVSNEQINIENRLSKEQQPMISDGPLTIKGDGPIQCGVLNPALWYWVTMTNVGNGAAINVKAWLEKDRCAPSYKGKTLHTGPAQLITGSSSDFLILFEDCDDDSTQGEYTLVIDYFDVLANQYRQSHAISIGENSQNKKRQASFDLSVDQQLVEKPKKNL